MRQDASVRLDGTLRIFIEGYLLQFGFTTYGQFVVVVEVICFTGIAFCFESRIGGDGNVLARQRFSGGPVEDCLLYTSPSPRDRG